MRNLSLVFGFLLSSLCSYGQLSVGGGVAYGAYYEDAGAQVRGMYQINERLRPSFSFNYYITTSPAITTITEFNAHLQYLGIRKERFNVYGLVGLNAFRIRVKDSFKLERFNDIGLDIGGGLDFRLSDKLSGIAEGKYDFSKNVNQWVISLGVLRNF